MSTTTRRGLHRTASKQDTIHQTISGLYVSMYLCMYVYSTRREQDKNIMFTTNEHPTVHYQSQYHSTNNPTTPPQQNNRTPPVIKHGSVSAPSWRLVDNTTSSLTSRLLAGHGGGGGGVVLACPWNSVVTIVFCLIMVLLCIRVTRLVERLMFDDDDEKYKKRVQV